MSGESTQRADSKVERELEVYRDMLALWKDENPIKTTKLQVLLATNALLVGFLQLSGGLLSKNWPLCMVGALLSGIWALSIGRTVLFQQRWKSRLQQLAERYPEDLRFQLLQGWEVDARPRLLLRVVGGVSSKVYLIGAPIFFCVAWCAALLVALACAS